MTADALATGAVALGVALNESAHARLLAYRDELARWGRVHNLTAVLDPDQMVPVHLLDSLALLPLVRGTRLADIGSGGGLPGLPLAIAQSGLEVTLVEPRAKRAAFLTHMIRLLALDNVIVARSRAEDLPGDLPARAGVGASDGYDTVVSRAFGNLAQFAAAAGHLCAEGGCLLAAKGRDPRAELGEIGAEWRCEIRPLTVPGVPAERHAVRLEPARPQGKV